ncbi:hypothetical protein E2C01_013569 [Portunus trituberculatus]|uniref:Uncharacterized protein n=1 Tax=Portunus trituberculatus TaxID=210409 RepID=A0A5B7DHN2_PORTR|nr:hypothetical protein [Portunus trituberculatus]
MTSIYIRTVTVSQTTAKPRQQQQQQWQPYNLGRGAEWCASGGGDSVGIVVHVLKEIFKAPQAAAAGTQATPGAAVFWIFAPVSHKLVISDNESSQLEAVHTSRFEGEAASQEINVNEQQQNKTNVTVLLVQLKFPASGHQSLPSRPVQLEAAGNSSSELPMRVLRLRMTKRQSK